MSYGLIGTHIDQSLSPAIHASFGDGEYRLFTLKTEELHVFLKERAFDGINVTMPFKKTVIPYLDECDPAALQIGAVNTVLNRNGKLIGYNTDYPALLDLFKRSEFDCRNKTVVIAGSGGTSNAAYFAANTLGAAEAIRLSRSKRDGFLLYKNASDAISKADVFINTTPCGSFACNDPYPFFPDSLKQVRAVVDVVYKPIQTPLLKWAEQRNIASVGGLYMLVMQAAYAYQLFHNKDVPPSLAEQTYQSLLLSEKNGKR